MIGVVLQVIQSAVVLFLAPLYTGFISRCEAIVESKRGPSLFQPYRDLVKLLRKESAISENATWIFPGSTIRHVLLLSDCLGHRPDHH